MNFDCKQYKLDFLKIKSLKRDFALELQKGNLKKAKMLKVIIEKEGKNLKKQLENAFPNYFTERFQKPEALKQLKNIVYLKNFNIFLNDFFGEKTPRTINQNIIKKTIEQVLNLPEISKLIEQPDINEARNIEKWKIRQAIKAVILQKITPNKNKNEIDLTAFSDDHNSLSFLRDKNILLDKKLSGFKIGKNIKNCYIKTQDLSNATESWNKAENCIIETGNILGIHKFGVETNKCFFKARDVELSEFLLNSKHCFAQVDNFKENYPFCHCHSICFFAKNILKSGLMEKSTHSYGLIKKIKSSYTLKETENATIEIDEIDVEELGKNSENLTIIFKENKNKKAFENLQSHQNVSIYQCEFDQQKKVNQYYIVYENYQDLRKNYQTNRIKVETAKSFEEIEKIGALRIIDNNENPKGLWILDQYSYSFINPNNLINLEKGKLVLRDVEKVQNPIINNISNGAVLNIDDPNFNCKNNLPKIIKNFKKLKSGVITQSQIDGNQKIIFFQGKRIDDIFKK